MAPTAGPAGVIDAVRDGGRYVTADAATLGRMSELVDGGVLSLHVAGTLPLGEAAEALAGRSVAASAAA